MTVRLSRQRWGTQKESIGTRTVFCGFVALLCALATCKTLDQNLKSFTNQVSFINQHGATNGYLLQDQTIGMSNDAAENDNSSTRMEGKPDILLTPNATMLASAASCNAHPIFRHHFGSNKDYISPFLEKSLTNPSSFLDTTYVVIGDSLDRIMVDAVCQTLGGSIQKVEPNKRLSRTQVCLASRFQIAYLNIFGMHRQCENGGFLRKADKRSFNTTAERISIVLPQVLELLSRATTPTSQEQTSIFVQIGSNLWDLSSGCNNQNGITKEYQDEYRKGIVDVAEATKVVLKNQFPIQPSKLFWKLAPPISQNYSVSAEASSLGRTRSNQQQLNEILKDVLKVNPTLGYIVDQWQVILKSIPSEEWLNMELQDDGKHFGKCPSLVFFNNWLQTIDVTSNNP